ncbi:hypothetical protein ASE04_13735 [Rhizobium sp. Root708]|nr:hypothetical protein ASE04_13735 [Rhizobium sp. Root708]
MAERLGRITADGDLIGMKRARCLTLHEAVFGTAVPVLPLTTSHALSVYIAASLAPPSITAPLWRRSTADWNRGRAGKA